MVAIDDVFAARQRDGATPTSCRSSNGVPNLGLQPTKARPVAAESVEVRGSAP